MTKQEAVVDRYAHDLVDALRFENTRELVVAREVRAGAGRGIRPREREHDDFPALEDLVGRDVFPLLVLAGLERDFRDRFTFEVLGAWQHGEFFSDRLDESSGRACKIQARCEACQLKVAIGPIGKN
jgi:hypothetical protein